MTARTSTSPPNATAAEVREFAVDLVRAGRDAAELDVHSNLHRVIVEWRATARILADPELTAQLTTPLPDDDASPRHPRDTDT